MRPDRGHGLGHLRVLADHQAGGHDGAHRARGSDDGGRRVVGSRGRDHHDDVGLVEFVEQARVMSVGGGTHRPQRHRLRAAIADLGHGCGQRVEACTAPWMFGDARDDLTGIGVEGDDARPPSSADGPVDAVAHLGGGGGPRATAAEDGAAGCNPPVASLAPELRHTDDCRTPSRTERSSRQASTNDASRGRTTAAERTLWWAGSTPGGVMPLSRNASIAFFSFWRALMMPVSAETSISLLRSTIGPMLSCSDASCIAMPFTPE